MLPGQLPVVGLEREPDIKIALSRHKPLGENLIALGIIDQETLKAARGEQHHRARASLGPKIYCNARRAPFGYDQGRSAGVASYFALIVRGRPAEGLGLTHQALAGAEKALGSGPYHRINPARRESTLVAPLEPKVKADRLTTQAPIRRGGGPNRQAAYRLAGDE